MAIWIEGIEIFEQAVLNAEAVIPAKAEIQYAAASRFHR
jgi:hypothetical protein